MTLKERNKLIDNYAWRVVDELSDEDCRRMVVSMIRNEFETERDEDVIDQVQEYYPDLLTE